MKNKIYPRPHDQQTVYLKDVITAPNIQVGDYTIYNDFVHDPRDFEKNNVLYHYPINGDRLIIGKFCSIACGAKFLFTSGNHSMKSLSTYTFPIFFDEWDLDAKSICDAWNNKGDTVIGNDVWIGYEAVIMPGVKIGDGAVIGTLRRRGRKVFAFCARRAGSGNFSLTRNSLHTRGSVWQTYPTAGSISCTFPWNRPHRCRSSGNARNIRRLRKPVLSFITPTSVPTPIIGCQGCRRSQKSTVSRSRPSISLIKHPRRMYPRRSRPMPCSGTVSS